VLDPGSLIWGARSGVLDPGCLIRGAWFSLEWQQLWWWRVPAPCSRCRPRGMRRRSGISEPRWTRAFTGSQIWTFKMDGVDQKL